jgi:hypothetical protein
MYRFHKIFLLVTITVTLLSASTAFPDEYGYIYESPFDYNICPSFSHNTPGTIFTGINDYGAIVGFNSYSASTESPIGFMKFRYGLPSIVNYPKPPYYTTTTAPTAINNDNWIVGNYSYEWRSDNSSGTYGFLDINNSYATLSYFANGINDNFKIVGTPYYDRMPVEPVTNGINNFGQTVGYSIDEHFRRQGFFHGFLLSNVTYPLPNLGKYYTIPRDLNDSGQVVGSYDDSHGFLWDSSTNQITILPDGYLAYGINNYGTIVGSFRDAKYWLHGFIAIRTPNLFQQTTGGWENTVTLNGRDDIRIDSNGQEIHLRYMKSVGCLVTDVAMLLDYFGHHTDPGKLNTYLKNLKNKDGNLLFPGPKSNLIPTKITQSFSYGQTNGIGPPIDFESGQFRRTSDTNYIVAQIKQAIETKGPIIMQVPSRNWGTEGYGDGHSHYIVAYAVADDGKILIRDPGWTHSNNFDLVSYINFVNSYLAVSHSHSGTVIGPDQQVPNGASLTWLFTTNNSSAFYYGRPLTPADPKYLKGQANCPIEFVITDPQGRHLGFNPTSQTFFLDIPDSSYFRYLPASPVDEEAPLPASGPNPIIFSIGDLITGTYKLDVFGTGDGDWSINFGLSDFYGYDPSKFQFAGVTTDGSLENFNFDINANPAPLPSTFFLLGSAILCLAAGKGSRFVK